MKSELQKLIDPLAIISYKASVIPDVDGVIYSTFVSIAQRVDNYRTDRGKTETSYRNKRDFQFTSKSPFKRWSHTRAMAGRITRRYRELDCQNHSYMGK